MSDQFVVRNVSDVESAQAGSLFIYCVGFETRSSFIATRIKPDPRSTLAIVYSKGRTLAFQDNLALAEKERFDTVDDARAGLELKLQSKVPLIRGSNEARIDVVVDVSSMDRAVMASVLVSVLDKMRSGDTVRVLYAPSAYKEPKLELLPISRVGAAHPRVSGQVDDPRKSRALFLGVGYEYGVSLNVLDSHEPDISFIFRPNGFDPRFSQSVEQANFGFDFGEQRNYEVIDYHLANSARVYDVMSSLVVSMKHNTSILAVPLGPKLLSAVMILIGYVHQPSVSVIRYSLSTWNYHRDVLADGMIVGFEVKKIARDQG